MARSSSWTWRSRQATVPAKVQRPRASQLGRRCVETSGDVIRKTLRANRGNLSRFFTRPEGFHSLVSFSGLGRTALMYLRSPPCRFVPAVNRVRLRYFWEIRTRTDWVTCASRVLISASRRNKASGTQKKCTMARTPSPTRETRALPGSGSRSGCRSRGSFLLRHDCRCFGQLCVDLRGVRWANTVIIFVRFC